MVMDYLTVTELVHYAKLKDANAGSYKPHQPTRQERIMTLMGRLKHDIALRLLQEERCATALPDYSRRASALLSGSTVQQTKNALLAHGYPLPSIYAELSRFVAAMAANRCARNATVPEEVALERDIGGEIAGVQVNGRMDMLEKTRTGVVVTELKVRLDAARDRKYSALQAAAYGLLCNSAGMEDVRVVLRTLPDNRSQDVDYAKQRKTLERLASEINSLPETAHIALWRGAGDV